MMSIHVVTSKYLHIMREKCWPLAFTLFLWVIFPRGFILLENYDITNKNWQRVNSEGNTKLTWSIKQSSILSQNKLFYFFRLERGVVFVLSRKWCSLFTPSLSGWVMDVWQFLMTKLWNTLFRLPGVRFQYYTQYLLL